MAIISKDGRPTENLQLEPGIKVQNDYKPVLSGKHLQLEGAVKDILGK